MSKININHHLEPSEIEMIQVRAGLLLPAVQKVRDAAAKMECRY